MLTFLGACVGEAAWLAGKAGCGAGRAVCGKALAEAGRRSAPLLSSPSCSRHTRAQFEQVAAVEARSAHCWTDSAAKVYTLQIHFCLWSALRFHFGVSIGNDEWEARATRCFTQGAAEQVQ